MSITTIISSIFKISASYAEAKIRKTSKSEKDLNKYIFERSRIVEAYNKLEKNKSSAELDSIRSQKRRDIRKLKSSMFNIIILVSSLTMISCTSRNILPEPLTVNELKSNERTYIIQEEFNVVTSEGIKRVDSSWAIVHIDLLKEFDELQDLVLHNEKSKNIYKMLIAAIISVITFNLILRLRK